MQKSLLNHQEIQVLIQELEKQKPNQKQIKKLCLQSGIAYSEDPIEQMSALLNYLQGYQIKGKSPRRLELEEN